jgi:hypothetical protein
MMASGVLPFWCLVCVLASGARRLPASPPSGLDQAMSPTISSGILESWRLGSLFSPFPDAIEVMEMEEVKKGGCNLLDWSKAHPHRRLAEASARAVTPISGLRDGERLPDFASMDLLVEWRPSANFLPAQYWQEGRQINYNSASALSSSTRSWREACGGSMAPSGSVPGGGGAGFELQLKKGPDRNLTFPFGDLQANSRDWNVICVSFVSCRGLCLVL